MATFAPVEPTSFDANGSVDAAISAHLKQMLSSLPADSQAPTEAMFVEGRSLLTSESDGEDVASNPQSLPAANPSAPNTPPKTDVATHNAFAQGFPVAPFQPSPQQGGRVQAAMPTVVALPSYAIGAGVSTTPVGFPTAALATPQQAAFAAYAVNGAAMIPFPQPGIQALPNPNAPLSAASRYPIQQQHHILAQAPQQHQQPQLSSQAAAGNNFNQAPTGVPNLYVSSLPNHYTTERFCEVFSQFGDIQSARLMLSREVPLLPNRSFGFVLYKSLESAMRALQLGNGMQLDGTTIQVMASRASAVQVDREMKPRQQKPSVYSADKGFHAPPPARRANFGPQGVIGFPAGPSQGAAVYAPQGMSLHGAPTAYMLPAGATAGAGGGAPMLLLATPNGFLPQGAMSMSAGGSGQPPQQHMLYYQAAPAGYGMQ